MSVQITAGDTVRYFQPDVEGILASWSGKPGGGGEVRSAVIAEVLSDGFYKTTDGIVLAAGDLR
jgi:hypothetical protein